MAFAQMVRKYPDLIICDFAQYYHIYDWKSIPIDTAAILACGLPAESRIVKQYTGVNVNLDTIIEALTLDSIRNLTYMLRGARGPKPESMAENLMKSRHERTSGMLDMSFDSSADFVNARNAILKKIGE